MKKEPETLIHTVRIYSQDIGMEFGIWKVPNDIWLTECNSQITTKLERTEKIKPILETDTIKKCKWKAGFENNISGELENYSRQNSPAETSSKE